MAIDKCKFLKIEDPANGGVETDPFPTTADPSEDYISAKGIAFEGNEIATIHSDSDQMKFKDTETSEITLKQIIKYSNFTPDNIIYVSKNGSDITGTGRIDFPFLTIGKALSVIVDASSSNPYNIAVGPGIFVEDTLNTKPYVIITGSGTQVTIISIDTPTKNCIVGSVSSAIRNLTISDAYGSGGCGVYIKNVSGYFGEPFLINDCIYTNNETQIKVDGSYGIVGAQIDYCRFDPNFIKGIVCTSGGYSALLYLNSISIFHSGPNVEDFVYLSGTGVEAFFSSVSCTSTSFLGNAIRMADGAKLIVTASSFEGFNKGLYIENVGSSSSIYGDFKLLNNTSYDLQISHAYASGCVTGISQFSKVFNAATETISLVYTDPVTGDFNVSRTIHMRGLATDITAITSASQTTQLLATDANTITVTGSTLGQIVKLPDATTIRTGHRQRIINAATVPITVQQYDGSKTITVYPSGSVLYILRLNPTSAGTWERAISSSAAFQGTAPVICGYGGNAGTGRYLEFVSGNASDGSPFTIIAPSTLVGISMSNNTAATTATVGIFRTTDLVNPIATLSLTNQVTTYSSAFSVNLATGDLLAVKITSGSMNKPFICFYIAGQ